MVLEGISTNKSEPVEVSGHVAISDNGEAAKIFYSVFFTSIPYTLQEDVESDGNHLSSGDFMCNTSYTYHGFPKLCFYVEPCKRHKSSVFLMRPVPITNLDINYFT